jgi:phage terminase large subunit-like protein
MAKSSIAELRNRLSKASFARRILPSLDPWQEQLMRSQSNRIILNIHRQGGKSAATALLALWHALYEESALVLVLSRSLRQSGELFQKIKAYYGELGKPVAATVEQRSQLELENGSRIISLPGSEGGDSIRGFSAPRILIVDEAARVDDRLYYAIRPMLAISEGRLILLSTPAGKQGVFHDEWFYGADWERYRVTADECPRISRAFLEQERHALPEPVFRQEYYGEFLSGVGQYFSEEDIEGVFSEDFEPYVPPSRRR